MKKELLHQALDYFLDSRDFYELMQSYRHTQIDAAKEFENIRFALREAIAQPVPIAEKDLKWCGHCGEGYAGFCRGKDAAQDCQMQTIPPARKPLRTSEILSMDIRGTNDEALRFARAIESAHGIGAKS